MEERAFDRYAGALRRAKNPRVKDYILERAEQEGDLTLEEFVRLVEMAYPEET